MKHPFISAVFEVALALLLIFGPPITRGDENKKTKETESIPVSDRVRAKLEALFQKHYPEASFTDRGVNGLHFEHEVRTFEFPYTGPKGAKHEAEEQRGPKKGGILCSVYGQPGSYRGQLALMSVKASTVAQYLIDRKEYKQLLMAPYSKKSDAHLWVALSYPPDVDEEFLKTFRQIMTDFEQAAE